VYKNVQHVHLWYIILVENTSTKKGKYNNSLVFIFDSSVEFVQKVYA